MIFMKQPSISLNSHDVPGPHYKMWKTVSLDKGASPNDIVAKIVNASMVSLASGGGRLRNIVINCHGSPGSLATGGSGQIGFSKDNLSIFAPLKPLHVGPIWLVACRAALAAEGIAFCQASQRLQALLLLPRMTIRRWGSGDPISSTEARRSVKLITTKVWCICFALTVPSRKISIRGTRCIPSCPRSTSFFEPARERDPG